MPFSATTSVMPLLPMFGRSRSSNGVTSPLEIVRTDGTGVARVVGEGASPDWSPDGTTIAATRSTGAVQLWDLALGTWTVRTPSLTPGGDTGFDGFPGIQRLH